jgi:hypothetical protein
MIGEEAVICGVCDQPILETGTAIDGKPCHIGCYHLALESKPNHERHMTEEDKKEDLEAYRSAEQHAEKMRKNGIEGAEVFDSPEELGRNIGSMADLQVTAASGFVYAHQTMDGNTGEIRVERTIGMVKFPDGRQAQVSIALSLFDEGLLNERPDTGGLLYVRDQIDAAQGDERSDHDDRE